MTMRLLLDPAVTSVGGAAGIAAVAEPPKPAAAAPAPAPAAPAPVAPPAPSVTAGTEPPPAPAAAAWATPKKTDPAPDPAKPAAAAVVPDPAAKPAAVVPAPEFTLKAPEGVKLEPAVLEGYKTLSKDLGLTSEQTQKLYERDLAAGQESHKAAVASLQRQDAAWHGELQTKWGEKYTERSVTVSRAYDYADPDGSFREDLKKAGLLYNPKLTEFVEKFGALFAEDKIPSGATGVPKVKDTRPQHERLAEAFKREAEKLNKKGK